MDTNKLANLLGKLEGYVQNVENSSNDPNALVQKLESLLERLEKVQANQGQVISNAQAAVSQSAPVASVSSASAGGASFVPLFKEKCFKNVQALLDCTNQDIKNEHLLEGVNLYLDMLKSQEAVFNTMAQCKKPADIQFMVQIAKDNK